MLAGLSREDALKIVESMSHDDLLKLKRAADATRKKRIETLRRNAIDSLAAFVRYLWPIVVPTRDLEWSWHMDAVCDFIECVYKHDDVRLREVYDAKSVEVAVCNIPPRCSKSTLFGVLSPAWWWLHDPGAQFLCLTKADKNAKRDARLMRQVIMSDRYQGLLRTLGKDWVFSDDQNQVHYFANTLGGHRISLTTQSDLIGVGADYIVIDDPHDVEEVALGSQSRVQRLMEEVQTRYEEIWLPRLNPPAGRTMIVMQRLNEMDLAGVVHSMGAARLVLPMEYEPEHDLGWKYDPRKEPGELLVPNRMGDDYLSKHRRSPMKWAGQYQQRPAPLEGGAIQRAWFDRYYTEDPETIAQRADEVWVTLDAAGKGEATSDRSAIQVWAREDAKWYLLWAYTKRVNLPELNTEMQQVLFRWGSYINRRPGGILVEDAQLGAAWIQLHRGKIPGIIPWHPSQTPGKGQGSKEDRARYFQKTAEAGNIYLPANQPSWLSPVNQDWFTFPSGAFDDHVDATSMLQVYYAVHGAKQVMRRAMAGLVVY